MISPWELLYWWAVGIVTLLTVLPAWYQAVFLYYRAFTDAAVVNQERLNGVMDKMRASFHHRMMNDPCVPANVKMAYMQYVGSEEPKGD